MIILEYLARFKIFFGIMIFFFLAGSRQSS